MKRLLALIVSLSFIAASSGASVNIHYCRGKVSSVSLSFLPTASCKCGKKTKMGCCKTETHLVKLTDNAKQPAFTTAPAMPVIEWAPIESLLVCKPVLTADRIIPISSSPPGSERQAVYLRNRVFRL
ncbi:MAG: hypothetical protein FGM61_02070 [Sediminibacterium sp.]|nr:hypothetical protein [Sediminibacterium sp.]